MTLPDVAFLRHMLDAMDRVAEAVSRTTLVGFKEDWVIQDAIMHELQILGEAAGRVSREVADAYPMSRGGKSLVFATSSYMTTSS